MSGGYPLTLLSENLFFSGGLDHLVFQIQT